MTLPVACPFSDEADCKTLKDFTLTSFSTAEAVGELQWNQHIPESNVLMHLENLKELEKLHADKMRFHYVFAKKDNLTVGVMYFQVVEFHANQLINYFPDITNANFMMKGLKVITEKVLNAINVRLLVSGNVFMTGENGFYFSGNVSKDMRAKILRKASNQLLENDSSLKAVLISDLYKPKTEFDTDFIKKGYSELTVESDMSIQLKGEWHSFDDYLNALSSKYRVRAKKVFTLCDENHVEKRELNAEEVEKYQDRIYELYNKVMARADFKLSELNKEFFAAQKKSLFNYYHVFGYFKDGVMIGFISAYKIGKRMEVHYVGMDHELCKPIHLYQHMMYDMIRLGIESKVTQLHFGRTAPEIKSTIGAIPSPMYGWLKHRNALFNILLARPYTANLKPKEYTFRNPFKEK